MHLIQFFQTSISISNSTDALSLDKNNLDSILNIKLDWGSNTRVIVKKSKKFILGLEQP